MKIAFCQILAAELRYRVPYVLSFTTVDKIRSIIIKLVLEDGGVGVGEAVALPGYSHETSKSIIRDLKRILPSLLEVDTDDLEEYLIREIAGSPFAISAILTAKELAKGELRLDKRLCVPLVAPVSSVKSTDNVVNMGLWLYAHGYRTIKVKVGRDIDSDCKSVSALLNQLPGDAKMRIDANQAYTFSEACQLLNTLEHGRCHLVECLEQPFGVNDWVMFRDFAKHSRDVVALMLDESIVSEGDIERAADAGATLIKLKLFKSRGMKGLNALRMKAKRCGLGVILGNGVASEIGNLCEALVFNESGDFVGAFEGNGFEKLVSHLLVNPPYECCGDLVWKRAGSDDEPMRIATECIAVIKEIGIDAKA